MIGACGAGVGRLWRARALRAQADSVRRRWVMKARKSPSGGRSKGGFLLTTLEIVPYLSKL